MTCGGRKRIMGLGMLEKECHECKGVGYVKEKLMADSEGKKQARKPKDEIKEEKYQ